MTRALIRLKEHARHQLSLPTNVETCHVTYQWNSRLRHGTTSVGSAGHPGVRTCSCVDQLQVTVDWQQPLKGPF